jgi:CRISPR/Cas system-associated exonuclease Cas4 (RecB family)
MDLISFPPSFTFSQASLQAYCDCPRRFQLRFIDHVEWPAVELEPVHENERRQKEGQKFHRMVQQHLIGLPAEKLSPFANTINLSRWWQNYLGHKLELSGYMVRTELTLAKAVGSYRLVAKFDLVAIKPGERGIIVDWKTNLKRPRDEWMAARMQTRVYRTMLVQAGATLNGGNSFHPEQIEMIYWYSDFPTEPAHFPYNSVQHKRDWDGLVGLIKEISNHQHFPLTDDENVCRFCTYRSYCNRDVKAGNLDEMAESELTDTELNFEQVAEIEF